jgi:two-component system sensor histidine kinase VanS
VNKKSFSIKIFAGVTCILLAVGLLVFGILRVFLPKTYEKDMTAQIIMNSEAFADNIKYAPKSEWVNLLMQFCFVNNTSAEIIDEDNGEVARLFTSVSTSEVTIDNVNERDLLDNRSTTYTFKFTSSDNKPYTLVFYFNEEPVEQVANTFKTLFPILFAVIFIISMLIAFFYTRFLVNIKNLQTVNEKLQADIKEEKRRRSFFSAVSHELKTPVTILKGELDGMILGVGKFKDRDKYLQEAYETTESIEKLVREIMTAAKLDIVELIPEEINLSEILSENLLKIDELIKEKDIKIKQEFLDTTVIADKKLMGIVISNIIGNAVKHSPQGTEIDIRFDEASGLSVTNHGTHIGETSSDSDLSGGLGLYIVKSILDLHGFKYSFENFGDGNIFTINFTKM